ncbi:hypothetical protein ALPO108162_04360 [Alicyclobacillus pomorum]
MIPVLRNGIKHALGHIPRAMDNCAQDSLNVRSTNMTCLISSIPEKESTNTQNATRPTCDPVAFCN